MCRDFCGRRSDEWNNGIIRIVQCDARKFNKGIKPDNKSERSSWWMFSNGMLCSFCPVLKMMIPSNVLELFRGKASLYVSTMIWNINVKGKILEMFEIPGK